jgi:hypothetical protein
MEEVMEDIVCLVDGKQYNLEPPVYADDAIRKAITNLLLSEGKPLTTKMHVVIRMKGKFSVDVYKLTGLLQQIEDVKTLAKEQSLPWEIDALMPGI